MGKLELNIGVGTEVGCQYRFSFFGLHIPLPLYQKDDDYSDVWKSWGFTYFDGGIHLNWGFKTKIVDMPWSYGSNVYHRVLSWDKKWIKDQGKDYNHKGSRTRFMDDRYVETFPYQYRLKSGEVQNVNATIHIEKRIWWWRMFHFLPFWFNPIIPFKIVNKCIGVDFDGEVGEEAGSWKGGTVGCGYKIKRGETGYQCLRRMESERLFQKGREY